MTDYNEQTVTGKSWQRCYAITVANPYASTPSIVFSEEVLTLLGDKSHRTSVLSVSLNYDPEKTFDLYDPVTLEPTGQQMTHQEMYLALFGAYMTTAKARDAAQAAPEPEPEPEPAP